MSGETTNGAIVNAPVVGGSTVIKQTAKEIPFRDGKVWIQTLNAIHRGDAERETHFNAAVKLQPIRKGQSTYKAYRSEFEAMPPVDRIDFLVNHEAVTGRLVAKIAKTKTFPAYPERTEDETDEKFTERIAKFEADVDKVTQSRVDAIKAAKATFRKELSGLPPNEVIDRCMTAHFETMYAKEYNSAALVQTLYRAVRQVDNHLAMYFSSPESVADLPDEELEYLQYEYDNINSVQPEEIPT